MRSLSARLLASVSVLLIVFFALTVGALDLVFSHLTERALLDRLDVQLLALISASDETHDDRLEPGVQLAEARFANLASGLYGEIVGADGVRSWRSNSLTGTGLEFGPPLAPGARRVATLRLADGTAVRALSLGVDWEFADGSSRSFTYSVAESLAPYVAQLGRFRRQLTGWFTALALTLLVALWALLRWVLTPLRRIEREIEDIEAGRRRGLGDGYPRELSGVKENLNALLVNERERVERYRRSLGNLAHSLKTPLAVTRALLEEQAAGAWPNRREVDAQIGRMDDIVKHHLRHAAASGGSGLGDTPLDVAEVLTPIVAALDKVYAGRGVRCRLEVEPGASYVGDRGDLTEIAGNLLDNAYKWCRREVAISARSLEPRSRRRGLEIRVEDDGPGIPDADRDRVLERGTRLDERVGGQGIGLAVVRELAELNRGSVVIETAPQGGTRVVVTLWPR
jgi:two-component system, OmpR family, sensor histidine kinase PhoQ